mgnify:CR=1 FL=1
MAKSFFSAVDGMEAEVGGEAEHHLPGGVSVVGNLTVEDGILDGVLDGAYFAAGTDAEGLHDIVITFLQNFLFLFHLNIMRYIILLFIEVRKCQISL